MVRFSLVATALVLGGAAQSSGAEAAADTHCTGHPGPVRFYVNVENLRPGGEVAVTLYRDDRKRFLKSKGGLYVGRVATKAPRTRMCIYLPSTGVWAFAVYHDQDGDRRFDRTKVGLPSEGYGFSRNPSTLFGLPAFNSVRLNVPRNNGETTIRIKYP